MTPPSSPPDHAFAPYAPYSDWCSLCDKRSADPSHFDDPPSSPRAGRSTVSAAGEPQRPPDEWLLSISIMEAARRIGLEMVVGHSWRELAMLTNTILADQLAAASPAGPGIRNRLLVSRFDPSVSLDELIGAGPEAVPQNEREGLRAALQRLTAAVDGVETARDECFCIQSPHADECGELLHALAAARAALASPAHPDEEPRP
jgi:hypothetical protein